MRFLYKAATNAYVLLVHAVAPFNKKAARWVLGRKRQKSSLNDIKVNVPLIWFHCASLGEYEQGLPVFEEIKTTHSDHKIVLSFFSPSGYEIRKNTPIANWNQFTFIVASSLLSRAVCLRPARSSDQHMSLNR